MTIDIEDVFNVYENKVVGGDHWNKVEAEVFVAVFASSEQAWEFIDGRGDFSVEKQRVGTARSYEDVWPITGDSNE